MTPDERTERFKPTVVLVAICLVTTLLLALVYELTKDTIAARAVADAAASRQEVMPLADTFDEVPEEDWADLDQSGLVTAAYEAKSGQDSVGYVFDVESYGYGTDPIVMIIGYDSEAGSVSGLRISSSSETAGLGKNAEKPEFYEQYTGAGTFGEALVVVKSGTSPREGEIEAMASATVTSNAVTRGANAALRLGEALAHPGGIAPEPIDPALADPVRPEVMPQADSFQEVPAEEWAGFDTSGMIAAVYRGLSGTDEVGYAFDVVTSGFGGPLSLIFGYDNASGTLSGMRVVESNESDGYGSKAEGATYYEQFAGLADAADIDAISGSTVTSDAVAAAADAALAMGRMMNDPDAVPAEGAGTEAPPADPALSQAVLPGSDTYEALGSAEWSSLTGSAFVTAVYRAYSGEAVAGYIINASAAGFGGPIELTCGYDSASGTLGGLRIISSNETDGYGAKAEEAAYTDQFAGLASSADIDGVSGATVTSDAIASAVDAVLQLGAELAVKDGGQ